MTVVETDEGRFQLPGLRFPVELPVPEGFDAADPATWPNVDGRLEYVGGRLLYMPPCADFQQVVVVPIVGVLDSWSAEHPEFIVGANEAGMKLGGDSRGADAAVWRKKDVLPFRHKYQNVPPILAVEVEGEYEDEQTLRRKADWYFEHGVEVVWNVLPRSREVVVLTPTSESRHRDGNLPAHPALPGLTPSVERFFRQVPVEP